MGAHERPAGRPKPAEKVSPRGVVKSRRAKNKTKEPKMRPRGELKVYV